MESVSKIKALVETLENDSTKFVEKGNKSAGVRARKTAQDIKILCQEVRKEILEISKG